MLSWGIGPTVSSEYLLNLQRDANFVRWINAEQAREAEAIEDVPLSIRVLFQGFAQAQR
jgi:hypothetical protein